MSKFKLGDKVKFVGNVNNHIFSNLLDLHKNDLIIKDIVDENNEERIRAIIDQDESNVLFAFEPDELELVKENIINFNIGKTVKIRDDLIKGKGYGCFTCTLDRFNERGKTGVIERISEKGNYFVNGHWFTKEMLEPYEPTPKEVVEMTGYTGTCNIKHVLIDDISDNISNDDLSEQCEKLYDLYENKKGEKEMENKVLELWYTRKKENIYKEYKDLEDKYVKEHYEVVKQYNELIQKFENDLEEFCTKYSDITIGEDFVICKDNDCNIYKYVIDEDVIRHDAESTYKSEKNEKYKKLQETYEDISALLSMSDNLEYQQSILIEYGIIDKKTKRMIVDEDNFK